MIVAQSQTVLFGPAGGSGPRETVDTLFMGRPVRHLLIGLSGFGAAFVSSSNGRPLGELKVAVGAPETLGNEIRVPVAFGLRDWSGDWDDEYQGWITYGLFAELEEEGAVGDAITINGLEISQAIQFFRSALDLDADTQQHDNALALISGKATAVRVYADFNPPDGIKGWQDGDPGDSYIGELEVSSPTASTLITDLRNASNPTRDTAQERASKNAVPFFVIPAEWCHDEVKIRGRLRVERPAGSIDTDWSPFFETTLRFSPGRTIPVHVVLFNYLGGGPGVLSDPPARAPTVEEAMSLFDLPERLFPTSGFDLSGFDTADIAGPSLQADFSDRIFNTLLDYKGDDPDLIVYGLFSEDFVSPVLSNEGFIAGGEAVVEFAVAWSMARMGGVAVAHELGHLYGVPHTPGGITPASDATPDYPTYGSYPEGSIGQNGVDTATAETKDPNAFFDFMSYATNRWISPFTHNALGSRLEPPFKAKLPPGIAPETLFLALRFHRHDKVTRLSSFHYPFRGRFPANAQGSFVAEIADECRNTLVCWPLTPSDRNESCWPKPLYAQVPYPTNARWLLIWEGDRLLYEECIGKPPRLDLICRTVDQGVELEWSSDPADDVWYLVHRREDGGAWRSLGPRSRQRSKFVPGPLAASSAFRVLATTGIATGVAQCQLGTTLGSPRPRVAVHEVMDVGSERRAWRASVLDEAGRVVRDARFLWFDDDGRQIQAGSVLSVERIRSGTRQVTAVLLNALEGSSLIRKTVKLGGR